MSIIDDDHLLYFKSKLTALYQTLFTPIAKSKGSATKPVYTDANGNITACTYTLGQNVTSSSKLTDTVTTVTTSGTGNAVTNITANNGALTVTKGDIAATSIAWSNITDKPSSFTPSSHTHSYAASGSAGGAATNVNITTTNPTSGTWYYIPFASGQTGSQAERANDGFRQYSLQGTASAIGHTYLQLGNSTASGTAGNKQGHLRIYNTSSGYTDVVTTASTSNRTITLPDASGTVSLTSHTHSGYLSTTGTAAKATGDASGNTITTSYGAYLTKTSENKSGDTYYYINLKSKSGAVLSKVNYRTDYYSCGA